MTTTRIRPRLNTAASVLAIMALATSGCAGDQAAADGAVDDPSAPSTAVAATEPPTDAADRESDDAEDDGTGGDAEVVDEVPADEGMCASIDDVSLQLQWFTQAQFAGYYAAQAQGYFADRCLQVTIVEGGIDVVPQAQLANGEADFALAWVPKALASREAGMDIVNIAQIFQRSGTLQVSFADSGITTPADLAGRVVGHWGAGNEYELFAALAEVGLDPATDVELVAQSFDMEALLSREIDAAEAMTYNEYAQVLEAINPDTGQLYQPDDFNVISYEDVGVGMLQDAIWADGARLADDEAYRDAAIRFVAASMEGWMYCRENVTVCADIVLAAGPTLRASHQLWEMNEVNQLIWPASNGVGFIDQEAWDRTVEISLGTPNLDGTTVLTAAPSNAFDNSIVEAAWDLLPVDADLAGTGYVPVDVVLAPGGD